MKKIVFVIFIFTLVLLSSCIYFVTINQPSVAGQNEIITVSITATTEGGEGEPYFGVCLPIGWTVPGDSLQCSGGYNEVIYYDSLISFEQENASPAPEGYYWWAGNGVADTAAVGVVNGELQIQTDNQVGLFSIDYMLGSSHPWAGVNQQRSDNHLIEIVDEYTPSGLQATVVGDFVILNWIEPSNTIGLLGYNIYRDEQQINAILVTDTTFTDENPLEGVYSYSISSLYDNGSEYLIPYEILVMFGNSLYVSPNGSNTNSGSSFSDALQTITFAMSVIVEDSLRPITIYLAPGYYSPFTNEEQYPITCLGYVSLVGSGEDFTFLYADAQNTVLQFVNAQDNAIDGLTITNGHNGINCSSSSVSFSNVTVSNNAGRGIECNNSNLSLINVTIADNNSGGIYCENTSSSLNNVTITDNNGSGINCGSSILDLLNVNITNNFAENGGGINCDNSTLELSNVTIKNNNAAESGGGINCVNSTLDLLNVNITNNSAGTGGGLNCLNNSILNFDSTNRCNIYLNRAVTGNDISSDALLDVVVEKFTVFNPTVFHASPIENFTFDILQGVMIQADADLFVSPDGDDTNSGLTENDPLKTIYCAFAKILADSLHPHTINLLEGTYSDSTTGEFFPVSIIDYVGLSGKSDSTVILKGGISIHGNKETMISDLTLSEGGVYCESSKAIFNSITIKNNGGVGLYCKNSSPSLINVTIANNGREGIRCDDSSSPTLEDVMIINNGRGGINCDDNSNPTLVNVTISDNYRDGIDCWDSSPSLINVTIANNEGSGIELRLSSNPTLVNVTISNNYGYGIWCRHNNSPTLTNCILWNNPPIIGGDSVVVNYSNIKGGWPGEGNINEDPLFVGTGNYPYILSSGSPCIDAGNPDFVFNDSEDPNNPGYTLWPAMGTLRNDMGAYGGPNAGSWNIVVGIEDDKTKELQTPTEFELAQNYPNPFNPTTNIQYSIKERASVELVLYDILGRKVEVLVNEEQDAGYYKVNFNAARLASGIYFYRLQADNFVETKKMLLLK